MLWLSGLHVSREHWRDVARGWRTRMWSPLPPAVSAGQPCLTLSAGPGESLVLLQLSTATSAQVLGDQQVTKPPGLAC